MLSNTNELLKIRNKKIKKGNVEITNKSSLNFLFHNYCVLKITADIVNSRPFIRIFIRNFVASILIIRITAVEKGESRAQGWRTLG